MPEEERSERNVIEPNYVGDDLTNLGVDSLTQNHGHGVAEALPEKKEEPVSAQKNKLRVQKAREFGQTKDKVGF